MDRKNSLIVDDDHQIIIKIDDKEYKSYLRYFLPPFSICKAIHWKLQP